MVTCKPGTTVYWDIDDTIIMWHVPENTNGVAELQIECNGFTSTVYYHIKHAELIRKYAERGATNIVWSHGGAIWAQAAITALGLERYVFACLNKPTMYYDDLPAEKFIKQRRYVNLETGKDELYG